MKKTLVLITAHPDKESLCYANADVVEASAKEQGYDVIRYEAYDFPLIDRHPATKGFRSEYDQISDDFATADSFVVLCPMWNFSLPGGLKNMLDGAIQAKKSFRFKKVLGRYGVPVGLMKAKKVTCVWTADGPGMAYRCMLPWNGVRHQIKSIFGYCGVKKYKQFVLAEVRWKHATPERKQKCMDAWFKKLKTYQW